MRARPLRAAFAALGTAGVITAVVLTATPAVAADTGFVFGGILTADENNAIVMAASGGAGKAYPAAVVGAGQVTDVSLTFDFAGLDGIATPSFPDGTSTCTLSGTTATCALPDIDTEDGVETQIPLVLTPKAGATDGAKASFTMTTAGTGAATDVEEITVKVADGSDLVATQTTDTAKVKPGDDAHLAYTITNTGNEDAHDVAGFFIFSHGFNPADYDDCLYSPIDELGGWAATCDLVPTLAAGDSITVDFPGSITPDAAAQEFAASDAVSDFTTDDLAKSSLLRKVRGKSVKFAKRAHSGRKLTVKTASTGGDAEIDGSDNFSFMEFDVATSHDATVFERPVKGAIGDKVTANLLVRDEGPASLNFLGGDFVDGILVTVPGWATVTDAPEECVGLTDPSDLPLSAASPDKNVGTAGFPYYACYDLNSSYLKVGDELGFPITFKITKDHGAAGTYALLPNTAATNGDTDRSNNSAKIDLVLDGQGSLPVTGSKVGIIGGVGGALVLLGGVLLVLGRRRKRAAAV
jgi:LPXTG-motif cell wall-anchored protein